MILLVLGGACRGSGTASDSTPSPTAAPTAAPTPAPSGEGEAATPTPAPDAPREPCAAAVDGAPADDPFRRVRTTRDQPDDQPDAYQFHIVYVEPADVTAPARLDEDGALRRSVTAWLGWMAHQTGGPKLRFDTCDGVLDVTYVKLADGLDELPLALGSDTLEPRGPIFLRDRLERTLKASFDHPKKLYLVYYEGLALGACGGAPHPPELPGRFTVEYLGGRFAASVLTSPADAGATTVDVYDPSKVGRFPATPFDATLGDEAVQVTAVDDTRITFAAALSGAHPSGTLLQAKQRPPDCRANPLSSDGRALGYAEFGSAHESLHPLGLVSDRAPHHADDAAPGHLDAEGAGGTHDLMYQGRSPWGCAGMIAPDPASATCVLDPSHAEYFSLPAGDPRADLAKSVFLEPTAPDAVTPLRW